MLDKTSGNYYDISIYEKAVKKRSTHIHPSREGSPPAERRSGEMVAKVALELGF